MIRLIIGGIVLYFALKILRKDIKKFRGAFKEVLEGIKEGLE